MIDFEEHFYTDDPNQGHPDVRTRLKGVNYFFLGNGLIQAVVQYSPEGEGTPIGLAIKNPILLRKKRDCSTFDPISGLDKTMLHIREEGKDYRFMPENMSARWTRKSHTPAVEVKWITNGLVIVELFYCPSTKNSCLNREITVRNKNKTTINIEILTGVPEGMIHRTFSIPSGSEAALLIVYNLNSDNDLVDIETHSAGNRGFFESIMPDKEMDAYWQNLTAISSKNPWIDHFYNASALQLPAVISKSGITDASVWQYNREWVRDHGFMALGLVYSGHHSIARTLIDRLLREFITEDGDAIDSSEKRHPDEVELDQNGILLHALHAYCQWTGDYDLAGDHWEKVIRTAEYPLSDKFRHKPSGLMYNRREFWERHSAMGVKPGIELAYQLFVALGLASASELAAHFNNNDKAEFWKRESERIKDAMLNHPQFSLIDKRGFIKRRCIDGSVQETIDPAPEAKLPDKVPLMMKWDHFINPDSSSILPIVYGIVPPDHPAVKPTMQNMELLWNQAWSDGGYGRYNYASEPDSPGAWTFPSIYIARACLETGEYDNFWRVLNWLSGVPGSISGAWFENYGPRLAPPFPQVGITHWSWSEFIMLTMRHIVKINPNGSEIQIEQSRLPGVEISGQIMFRGKRIAF